MARLPMNLHSYEHGGIPSPHPAILAPAMMLLPLLRWPLGYEIAHPKAFFVRVLFMYFLPYVVWLLAGMLGWMTPADEGRLFYDGFIALCVFITLLRFARRAIGQHRGEEIHSFEAGYSVFARLLPLPAMLTEQLLVPALLAWLGWMVLLAVSVDLGLWLMLAGFSYFLLANWERRNLLSKRRAPVDDKIRAHVFADDLDGHEQRATRRTAKAKSKAGAAQSGDASPDIAELGGGRRK